MSITICLPLPAKELSPNARCHWRVKAAHARCARQDALCVAKDAMWRHSLAGGWNAALVNVQCVFADRRRRDLDNMLACLKPTFDGIVDAGLLVDDAGLTFVLPPARVDKATAGVVITITPIAEGEGG